MPELADITTCVLCGTKFSSPRLQIIIGQPNARLESYVQGLTEHLAQRHPQQLAMIVGHAGAIMEMLLLRNFTTTDAELSEQQDRVRWQVHQQTLKARYPDENLTTQCRELANALVEISDDATKRGIPHEDTRDAFRILLIGVFTSIRDGLEEPGKYPQPVVQQSKVLV